MVEVRGQGHASVIIQLLSLTVPIAQEREQKMEPATLSIAQFGVTTLRHLHVLLPVATV